MSVTSSAPGSLAYVSAQLDGLVWLLIALAFAFLVCAAIVAGGAWHGAPHWFGWAGLASFLLAWLVP